LNFFKNLVIRLFSSLGFSIYKTKVAEHTLLENNYIQHLQKFAKPGTLMNFLSGSDLTAQLPLKEVQEIVLKSTSQLGQDVLALSSLGTHKPGFFVEFGAASGVELSNTYILEKDFGWKGILCEPGLNWHNQLKANRDSIIDSRCVFSSSGVLIDFSESSEGELSTIKDFTESDSHSRTISRSYKVTTVSLTDLLSEHRAPKFIDFISIDTEGSEYEILRDFDFETYRFGLICVEHNYTENRGRIFDLLTYKGYRRVYEEFSQWDDWYVSYG
jgi:FkbM family methyltransferase